jgi:hypothetical protein
MLRSALTCFFVVGALEVACTSTTPTPTPDAGPTGGPVSGAKDAHCGSKVQPTSQDACHPDAGAPQDDGGADDAGDTPAYGPTMYNDEADDDDCKYHVKWSADAIRQGSDVTFTVIATAKSDGKPLTGSPVRAEVYLNDTHPAPNTKQASKETTAGTYSVGPIRFDQPGQWTVRFHFFENCVDLLDTSPHGHAAFFVSVP